MTRLTACAALAVLLIDQGHAQGDVIWDYSPETTGATTSSGWGTWSEDYNYFEAIHFPSAVQVTGMDIYVREADIWLVSVGDWATIRLRRNTVNGIPSHALISEFTERVSRIDREGAGAGQFRVHVDFATPLNLSAGTTYWIGMSGTYNWFSQTGLTGASAPGDSRMAQFNSLDFQYFTSSYVGDMAFRLHGGPRLLPVAISGYETTNNSRKNKKGQPFAGLFSIAEFVVDDAGLVCGVGTIDGQVGQSSASNQHVNGKSSKAKPPKPPKGVVRNYASELGIARLEVAETDSGCRIIGISFGKERIPVMTLGAKQPTFVALDEAWLDAEIDLADGTLEEAVCLLGEESGFVNAGDIPDLLSELAVQGLLQEGETVDGLLQQLADQLNDADYPVTSSSP